MGMGRRNKQLDNDIVKTLFIIFSALLSIRFFASFLPHMRLWGLNHAAFIVDGAFIFYVILFFVGFYLYTSKNKTKWLQDDEPIEHPGLRPLGNIYVYIIFALFSIAFYLFSAKAHFLGDGLAVIAGLSNPDLGLKIMEYGEEFLHLLFLTSLGGFTREFSHFTYQTISIISGIVFLIVLLYYTAKIVQSWSEYYIFLFLTLFSAIILLFFGYIENYSITSAMLYLMILSSLASLHNKKKSILPVIAFCTAVFLHKLSLVYLPAIVIYMGVTFFGATIRGHVVKYNKRIIGVLCMLFLILYIAVKLWGPLFWQLAFLSPFGDRFTIDNYYLLSLNHIMDYANLMVLMIPVTLVIFLIKSKLPKNEESPVSGEIATFLGTTTVFGLMAVFFIDPKLGMARDWDIMATILIGASITGSYLWINLFRKIKHFKTASLILILITFSIFIPWLSIHNSLGSLYRYTMAVMELDPQHNRSGLLTLKRIGKDAGNFREVARLAKQFDIYFPEIKVGKKAARYFKKGQFPKAAKLFQQVINANPGFYGAYNDLANCYTKLGKDELALENLLIADGLNPHSAKVNYDIGVAYHSLGEANKAIDYWYRCLNYNRSFPQAYLSLANYFLDNRQYDSTIHYLSELPNSVYSPESFYIRGMAHLALADTITAEENYHKYLQVGSDSLFINEIKDIQTQIYQTR